MAEILDGSATAAEVRAELAKEVERYVGAGNRKPGLAVILVGDDPASQIYVKNKVAACKKTGIESWLYEMKADSTKEEVLEKLHELNNNGAVDGILVQLPLPKHLPTEEILTEICPEKDADGLHHVNMGLLFAGKHGPRPCTPSGIMVLLDRYGVELKGKKAVVVGRSNLVGKPIALMLLERHATVTMCHSRTQNLEAECKTADVLIAAAGQPQLIKASWIKQGAVVVDVGIHRQEKPDGGSKIVGDVDFDQAQSVASKITPVPGGVGPMTIAMLLANTVSAYKRKVSANMPASVLQ